MSTHLGTLHHLGEKPVEGEEKKFLNRGYDHAERKEIHRRHGEKLEEERSRSRRPALSKRAEWERGGARTHRGRSAGLLLKMGLVKGAEGEHRESLRKEDIPFRNLIQKSTRCGN